MNKSLKIQYISNDGYKIFDGNGLVCTELDIALIFQRVIAITTISKIVGADPLNLC